MDQFVEKVNSILEREFPGIEIALAVKRSISKVGGLLIWSGFAGKDQLERQSLVWKVLKDNLKQEEQLKLVTILTVTPSEVSATKEEMLA